MQKENSQNKGNAGKKKVKKVAKNVPFAIVNINAGFNNTLVSVSDANGNVVSSSSSGKLGFKGAKKSTPHVSSLVVLDALSNAMQFGLKTVGIVVKGLGTGREAALRAFSNQDVIVIYILDRTPMPHNGCRPKKRRKV